MYDHLMTFKRYMQEYNIDINIKGATYMSNKQEKMLFTKVRNSRKQFLPTIINTSLISFNMKQIYEDDIIAHKMMIYKTINNNNYYVENITPIEDSNSYNIILRTYAEHVNTLSKILQTLGINIINITQDILELSYNERMELENNMKERNSMINDLTYKNIKKYTWSEDNIKNTYNEIVQHNGTIMRCIEIPIYIVSCTSSNNESEMNIAYRRMLELPIDIKYFIIKYDTDARSFIISIQDDDLMNFITQAIAHNIPFKKLNKYCISEDNIDSITHIILDNNAIRATYNTGTGFLVCKDIYLQAKITYNDKNSDDEKLFKSNFYYDMRDLEVLIRDMTSDVPTNKIILQTIINPSQCDKMKEILHDDNVSIKITGSTSMITPEEQKEKERLIQERMTLQKTFIRIAKAKFTIMSKSNEEIDTVFYKQMIYTTCNIDGYYINDISIDSTSDCHLCISITMLQDKVNIIKQIMKKQEIEFTNYEEHIIESTKEEIDKIMLHMMERQDMLKGVDINEVKHMTFSNIKEQQIKAYIDTWDTHNIQEYDIIMNMKQQTNDCNSNKYTKLKAIKKLPLNCEFWVIENSKYDTNTYTIISNASNDKCIINQLDAMNIPFKKGKQYIISEENINKLIWNILNNIAIEHTSKQHRFSFNKEHLYIRAIHTVEIQEEIILIMQRIIFMIIAGILKYY